MLFVYVSLCDEYINRLKRRDLYKSLFKYQKFLENQPVNSFCNWSTFKMQFHNYRAESNFRLASTITIKTFNISPFKA